jgi:AcrR family transcriptional regulator
MLSRDRLLQAATELYAETGFRGATTRGIARRAGVNEVTLFRQFGSKNALLQEAIRCACGTGAAPRLPSRPDRVREELLEWSRAVWQGLWRQRGVIRTALGDLESFPELSPRATSGTTRAARELLAYLRRLRSAGRIPASIDPRSAAAMLLGTLFADALSREVLPVLYRQASGEAIPRYVDRFLRAIELSPRKSRVSGSEAR